MASIIQLREERAKAFSRMKYIQDRVDKADRAYSKAEDAEFTQLEAKFKTLSAEIEEREKAQRAELERQLAEVDRDHVGGQYAAGEWLAAELRGLLGDSGAGASFTPVDYPNRFFDLLAAQSVGLRSGFTVIPRTGTR